MQHTTRRQSARQGVAALALLLALPVAVAAQQANADRLRGWERHEQLAATSPTAGLPWQFIGPVNISGRITDVVATTPRGSSYTIYVGSASGGVWKTVNEGVTWEPIFQYAASTAIGDIALDPRNQQVLWVGTGEANIFRSSNAGTGIYRTTDGGRTWQHMGLAETHTIARIIVHPSNSDIVYVAAGGTEWTKNTERGVFKTTDGGRTWQKILYINDETAAIDLVMDPRDPELLYAATWQRTRRKWNDPRAEPHHTGSGIHRTTDGGRTWKQINEGLPAPAQRGRIGIDIARSQPNTLYAFVDNYEKAREAEPGALDSYGRPMAAPIKGATIYRSDDRGDHWRQVSETSQYMERASGTYGWVFGQLRVDPKNPERVYFLGLQLNVSDDGGRTFRRLEGMHVDHHGLWIDPDNPNYLIDSNDGGVYVSYDAGANWRNFTNLLPLVQFFNVGYDMDTPFRIYGSIQDHGSYRGVVDLSRGRSAIPAVEFESAPGGEGSQHVIDPRDPDIVYSAGFYGNISRTDMRTGAAVNITPQAAEGEPAMRGQWLAPFSLSPHNPDLLYHGFQYVHRSLDRGDTWERISPDLTGNDPARLGDIPFQTLFSLAESPLRFGLIYAGTDDGRVHVTHDGGRNWTRIAQQLPADKFIAELVPSKYDEATVYMVQNGKRDDDFRAYIWKSTDYGRSWTSIVGNIPVGPVNVIRADPKRADVLYVGTDMGAYFTLNGGRDWQVLGGGLPSTYLHDIIIHPRDEILVAATHGRGVWTLDVRPIQQLTPALMAQDVAVLQLEPALLPRTSRTVRPAEIHFWLKQAGSAQVVIRDAKGQEILTLPVNGKAGLNLVSWELNRAQTAAAQQQSGYRGARNLVTPGIYTVEVKQGGRTASGLVQVSR